MMRGVTIATLLLGGCGGPRWEEPSPSARLTMTSVRAYADDSGWHIEADVEPPSTIVPGEILMAKAVCRREGRYVAARTRFFYDVERWLDPSTYTRIHGSVHIVGMRYPERCEVRVALAARNGGDGELVGVACFDGDGAARLGPCDDFEPPDSRWALRSAELHEIHTESTTHELGVTHSIGFRVHLNRPSEDLLSVVVVVACEDGDEWRQERESYDLRMWPFHWRSGKSAALLAGADTRSLERKCQTSVWLRAKGDDDVAFSELATLCDRDGVVDEGPCAGAPEADPAEPE